MSFYKSPSTLCCVYGCSSQLNVFNKLTFHKFPKGNVLHNGKRLQLLWLEALKITKTYVKSMVVCERHFNEQDFEEKDGFRQLKAGVVPSVCLPTVWRNKFFPRDYGRLIKLIEVRGIGRLRLCFEAKLGRKLKNSAEKRKRDKKRKRSYKKQVVNQTAEEAADKDGDDVTITEDLIQLSTSNNPSGMPVPLPPAPSSEDPFTSEIDIKDEPLSDQEETIEDMLAKMNEEPADSKNQDNTDQKDVSEPETQSTCKTCGVRECSCLPERNMSYEKELNTPILTPASHWSPSLKKGKLEDLCCQICMIGFSLAEHLTEHNKALHSKSKRPYTCILCNESFRTKNGLMEHVAKHALISTFRCRVCGQYSTSKDELDDHFRGHRIMKRVYSCRECKDSFKTKAACWDHLNIHIRGRLKNGHPCDVCGRVLSTRFTLKEHMLIHSGEKPYECQLCGRKIRHRNNFLLHVQGHTLGLPHQCQSCGMSFNKKSELNIHISNEHPEERDYDCMICGLKFRTESRFLKHAVTHDAHLEDEC